MVEATPDQAQILSDAYESLQKALAEEKDFPFPYLFDQSQEVAKSFGAVCTPDIFLYSSKNEVFYHGQFDDSRPNSGLSVTGESLITAMDLLISGEEPPEDIKNCVGCSIKWYADEFQFKVMFYNV